VRVGCINLHLCKGENLERLLEIVSQPNFMFCGIVESWLKYGSFEVKNVLESSAFVWVGKDRFSRRGGGIGFLVRRDCKFRIPKRSKCESLLWLEFNMEGRRLFCAIVYLRPKDPEGKSF